jgi:imidazolonepropionase-like amidohydrolase
LGYSARAAAGAGRLAGPVSPALRDSSCGTLEPGKRADFVLLRRNPLDDITAVYEVDSVFRGGRQVSASSLCGVLADNP